MTATVTPTHRVVTELTARTENVEHKIIHVHFFFIQTCMTVPTENTDCCGTKEKHIGIWKKKN
jgi:hypothetical protein